MKRNKNSDSNSDEIIARLRRKLQGYGDTSAAAEWLRMHKDRVSELFSPRVRDFVFEPIKDVFKVQGRDSHSEIRSVITRVAVANAVLAGLPGRMGVGVAVSIALEGWMAFAIARRVGLRVEGPSDIWKYFSLLAGVIVTILWLFKQLLGFAFSIFSVIPEINPLILAELAVTNLVGVCFWVGFSEAKMRGSFRVPVRAARGIVAETKKLYQFQAEILTRNLNPKNLKLVWGRLTAWLKGEIPSNRPELRGEVLATAAMAYLLAGKGDELEGPIGQEFLQSIRDRYPDLAEASTAEIAGVMSNYDAEQLAGAISMLKGRLFERLVTKYENADGDEWVSHLHDDQSYPGSDILLSNLSTGEQLEVSLKATNSSDYIEAALLKYPDTPLMTTEEMAAVFADNDMVIGHSLSNLELTEITEDNFDTMLNQLVPVDPAMVAGSGVAAGAAATLWPFMAAYLRNRITAEQLQEACVRVFGDSGKALATRLSYAVIFGPVFAWYLLARGTMGLVRMAEEQPPYRLSVSLS